MIIGSWVDDAACSTREAQLFFADRERGSTLRSRDDAARAICLTCPVRLPCLQFALDHAENDGVWGGFTVAERTHIRRKLTIARRRNANADVTTVVPDLSNRIDMNGNATHEPTAVPRNVDDRAY